MNHFLPIPSHQPSLPPHQPLFQVGYDERGYRHDQHAAQEEEPDQRAEGAQELEQGTEKGKKQK